jgi:putative methyltransferase (TIGR04325 family)
MTAQLIDFYYRHIKGWGWFGDFPTWEAAERVCTGYDAAAIFEKVHAASLAVKRGEAAYERDSVLFDKPEYDDFLIKCLKKVMDTEGYLSVVDFGGALGSYYFQHRDFLKTLPKVQWTVVEQSQFVSIGKRDFEDATLKFAEKIDDVAPPQYLKPNLLLCATTLQYLEKPYDWLTHFGATQVPYLLLDNVLFSGRATDRLTQQIVHPNCYKASYPCWFLSENKFKNQLNAQFSVLDERQMRHENNVKNFIFHSFFAKMNIETK